MLKIFVPRYDRATTDNARLAHDVFPNSPRNLVVAEQATRSRLHALFGEKSTTALLVMAHGDSDCVIAQNGEIGLDLMDVRNDVGGVLRLPIFAWVCRSSLQIGQVFHQLAKPGAAWWGYRTTVSAPDPGQIKAYREVLEYITTRFHLVSTEKTANEFFYGLQTLCDGHYFEVVREIALSGEFGYAHESAVGLREAWQHLDAMLPGLPQPFHADMVVAPVLNGV